MLFFLKYANIKTNGLNLYITPIVYKYPSIDLKSIYNIWDITPDQNNSSNDNSYNFDYAYKSVEIEKSISYVETSAEK